MSGLVVQQIDEVWPWSSARCWRERARRRGLAVGATLGAINAALLVGLQLLRGSGRRKSSFAQPVLHAFVGGIGGMLGAAIWRAART